MAISLNQLLSSSDVPSLPEVAQRVVEVTQGPNPDFDALIDVIKSDPAICSRLMRTVNSALFGLRYRVATIEAAVPVLGANMVRTLVLSFTIADHSGPGGRMRRYYQRLWRSSLLQAAIAEALAEHSPDADGAIWFLGGLLQDIGRISLMAAAPEEYGELVRRHDNGQALLEAERARFGFAHTDLSTQLVIRWRLENYLADAISKHHGGVLPVDTPREELQTVASLPNALRCASLCSQYFETMRSAGEADFESLAADIKSAFQMDADEVEEMLIGAGARVEEIAAMFAIDVGHCKPMVQLLAEAKNALAQLAVQSQLEATSVRQHIDEARRELEAAKRESRTLLKQSQMDELTGAFSRRALDNVFENAVSYCCAHGLQLGVLFIDVDRFKSLNDNYGHSVGDEMLTSLVDAIKGQLRNSDLIVRYGGDEFLVVVPLSNCEILVRISEMIRSSVANVDLNLTPEPSDPPTCSIGAVCTDPSDGLFESANRLVEEADQAMYSAKQRGGDQVVAFHLRGRVATPIGSKVNA